MSSSLCSRVDAADVKEEELQIARRKNRAKGIDMKRQLEHLQEFFITYIPFLSLLMAKIYGDQAPNRNALSGSACCLIRSPKDRGSSYSSRRTRADSPTFCSMESLALHGRSLSSAHPSIAVSSGYIMKRRSRNFGARVVLYSGENILLLLKLLCDILQRSGVPTDLPQQLIEMLLNCTSGSRVAIQSAGKIELACYLLSGVLAAVATGGNILPISKVRGNGTVKSMMLRLLSVFRGSGETSAPTRILKGPEFVIDIDPLWIIDSGAGASLTGNWRLLQGIHDAHAMRFTVANGEDVWSYYCGRTSGRVNLSGIRFAPGCHQNIISATHLVRLGCEVIFDDQGCSIRKSGTLIGKTPINASDGLYYLDFLRDAMLVSSCPGCPHRN